MAKAKPAYQELKDACAEVVRVMRSGEPMTVREYEQCKDAVALAEAEGKAQLEPTTRTVKRLRRLIGELSELPMGCCGFYHAAAPPYHRDPLPIVIHGLQVTLQKMLEKGETQQ